MLMLDPLDEHYTTVARYLAQGRVIPFLGAGVNLCGRPQGVTWHGCYLPSGGELSAYLAENLGYPLSETTVNCPSCNSEITLPEIKEQQDLVRVSQYLTVRDGSGPLYLELHSLLDNDYPITPLHRFLATLPSTLRRKGYPRSHQLIVTTNYDDVLERAFQQACEPYDVVYYEADGEHRGKFWHRPPNSEAELIEKPNESELSIEQQTVILKIHGAVDRVHPGQDSYVITEDHYIDYLVRTTFSNLIPIQLAAKLRDSHFLFLGYGLRDWNLRVILQRMWGEQKLTYKSWAIQLHPHDIDKKFWAKHDVDILGVGLEDYVVTLDQRIQALPQWQSRK
jgi:hypothetical protein